MVQKRCFGNPPFDVDARSPVMLRESEMHCGSELSWEMQKMSPSFPRREQVTTREAQKQHEMWGVRQPSDAQEFLGEQWKNPHVCGGAEPL